MKKRPSMKMPDLSNLHQVLKHLIGHEAYSKLIKKWNEPHRFYHNQKHLDNLLYRLKSDTLHFGSADYADLTIAIAFHDAVYYPWRTDNEEASVAFLSEVAPMWASPRIVQAILDTKTHKPSTPFSKSLSDYDMEILKTSNWNELLRYEDQIFKEYQYADLSDYRLNRSKFLLESAISEGNHLLLELSTYVKTKTYKIAIFPGSFNPYHIGHEEVRAKAERLFDKVILAVGINPAKAADAENNFKVLKEKFPQYQVVKYDTLLSDFVKSKDYPVTIVRGLRNGEDFGYEQRTLRFLQEFNPAVEIIYIPSSSQTEHISSSAIREISKFDTEAVKKYLV